MSQMGKLFLLRKNFFTKKNVLPKRLYFLKSQRRTFMSSSVTFSEFQTMDDVRKQLIKTLDIDYPYTTEPKSKSYLAKYLPKSQSELPVRKMKDSFDFAIVPLSTNLELRDKYTTFQGSVRFGRLMEDLDLFAVWCCIKHLTNPSAEKSQPFPYVIVTIRVDHIEVTSDLIQPVSDIRLSGHVCWVGTSSLEVIVWLDQENNGKWERITKAFLLMAARDPTNTGPGIVNAIVAETPEEKELIQGGEERKVKRLEMMKQSLLKTVPSQEELHLIHNLFIKTMDSKEVFLNKKNLPPNGKWMENATLNNLVFCHPEHRNLHNKIFGGFLMRQALELSWGTAFLYGLKVPKLINISEIGFYSPVDIGSLLKLYSSVTYSEGEFIQVFVYAEAFSSFNLEGKSTTSFNFTYSLGKPCDSLYPSTYLEAMKYIDGRRRFYEYVNSSQKNHKKVRRTKGETQFSENLMARVISPK